MKHRDRQRDVTMSLPINDDGTLPYLRDDRGKPYLDPDVAAAINGGGGPHDHDADYSDIGHSHGGGGDHDHDLAYSALAHAHSEYATDDDLTTHEGTAHGLSSHAIDGVYHSGSEVLPTTGQKNALAGTSGTPGDTNRYVTHQDGRLSDARTPTAHAHVIDDTTDLQTSLDAKATSGHDHDADYSASGHSHTLVDGDIPAAIARDTEVTAAIDAHLLDATHGGEGGHPDLATHDTLGLATQAELDGHDHDADYSATAHTHGQLHDRQHSVTSASDHAFPGGTTNFLRADGSFAAPPGGGEAFPVGSVFLAVVSTDPGTLLGYGTWSAFGAGRMLVGRDSGDAAFDTAEETGGAKTHSHAFTQPDAHTDVITHTHTTDSQGAHVHDEFQNSATTGGLAGWAARDTSTNTPVITDYDTGSAGAHTHTAAAPAGAVASISHSGGAVTDGSTLPPYIVVYMWKRTA